jgi:hypothetical protein
MDESRFQAGWRIVATLPAGTPLIAGIDALCARHDVADAEIRVTGAVRDAAVSVDDAGDPWVLPGVSQLVLGQGHLVPDLGVTGFSAVLAWSDRGQPRVLAGFLERAESVGVRVVIESFDGGEAAPRQALGSSSGASSPASSPPASGSTPRARPPTPSAAGQAPNRPPAAENARPGVVPAARNPAAPTAAPAGAGATPPAPAASSGWGAAVALSKATPPPNVVGRPGQPPVTANGAGPLDEDPDPKPGDILVHSQFGRCKVMSTTDADRVKIRTATGRFVDLHLGFVRLVRQADEDGQRVFRVQPTKR